MINMPQLSADLTPAIGDYHFKEDMTRRGLNVYTLTDVIGIVGRNQQGQLVKGNQEVPLFGLSIIDRVAIAQKCTPVYAVITGRMQRIKGLEWSVIRESKEQDRFEWRMKQLKQIYDEFAVAKELKYQIARFKAVQEIQAKVPTVLPDLSNFDRALLRWKRNVESVNDDACQEIEDWMRQPNPHDDFDDFTQKWVGDWLIHGGNGIYKWRGSEKRIEAVYHLPGGTVVPLKNRYVGPQKMYAQIVPGMDPKIYFPDELLWTTYMPTTGISYGFIPLEALVNKIAESLFFDQRAADMADGTRPPEKLAVFGGEKLPFGGLTDSEAPEIPLSSNEQSRLETLINEPRKNAIRVLSGRGTPAILDLSRGDTFEAQNARQKDILQAVAMVYHASNMEVNLTGGEDTSGRSTSEAQGDIEREKGIYPIVLDLQNGWNYNILPERFGRGYMFQYKSGLSDKEQAEIEQTQMATGTYSPNEIRVARGAEPWGPQYDLPQQGQATQGAPDGSSVKPFNMKAV